MLYYIFGGKMKSTFVSKQAELEFYLLELDGKQRNDKLGITSDCYHDKLVAQLWHNEIVEYVKDPAALLVLDTLYNTMLCDDYDLWVE